MSSTDTQHRVIIAGSRDIENDAHSRELISDLITKYEQTFNEKITHTLSGRGAGVDRIGEEVAKSLGLATYPYPAEWSAYGLSAGPIRNRTMAANAEGLILFWDGKSKGSFNMLSEATRLGINVITHIRGQ